MTSQEEKFVVGFDLDGVIVDHTENKIRVGARYGVALKPEDTASERMEHLFDVATYREIRQTLYDDPLVALSPPLVDGAFDTIARLQECGVPFFLISRRKEPLWAIQLLAKHKLWDNFFTKENTFFVDSMDGKEPVAKGLNVTHFFDDESRILERLPSVRHRFLFDARNQYPDALFPRVKNWGEVAHVLGLLNA